MDSENSIMQVLIPCLKPTLGKGADLIRAPGGHQQMTVVNESGLYSLILGSRKPEAKKFKKWVTAEVLPAIRKTGHYEIPDVSGASKSIPYATKEQHEKKTRNIRSHGR